MHELHQTRVLVCGSYPKKIHNLPHFQCTSDDQLFSKHGIKLTNATSGFLQTPSTTRGLSVGTHCVPEMTHTHTQARGTSVSHTFLSSPLSPTSSVSFRQRGPSVSCMSIQYGCWQGLNFIITFPRLTEQHTRGREGHVKPQAAPYQRQRLGVLGNTPYLFIADIALEM